jgi:hypothetical protein
MAVPKHDTCTDPQIHEPKGISTARKGEVYVADGSGSGDWKPRGVRVAILTHELVASDHPTPVANTWTKATLNTEKDPDAIVNLSSSVFTLGAGTYIVKAKKIFAIKSGHVGSMRLRIQNTSDSLTFGPGISASQGTLSTHNNSSLDAEVATVFTITAAKNFELQYMNYYAVSETAGVTDGLAAGNDIYAQVEIWMLK